MSGASFTTVARWPVVTVRVGGRLDRAGVARLRTELARWRQAGPRELRLDLSTLGDAGTPAGPGLARALAWVAFQYRGNAVNLIITGAGASLRTQLAAEAAAVTLCHRGYGDGPTALVNPTDIAAAARDTRSAREMSHAAGDRAGDATGAR